MEFKLRKKGKFEEANKFVINLPGPKIVCLERWEE